MFWGTFGSGLGQVRLNLKWLLPAKAKVVKRGVWHLGGVTLQKRIFSNHLRMIPTRCVPNLKRILPAKAKIAKNGCATQGVWLCSGLGLVQVWSHSCLCLTFIWVWSGLGLAKFDVLTFSTVFNFFNLVQPELVLGPA